MSDDFSEAFTAKIADKCLPVGPVAVFKDSLGEPGRVFVWIDVLGANVPEKMRRERGHGGGVKS